MFVRVCPGVQARNTPLIVSTGEEVVQALRFCHTTMKASGPMQHMLRYARRAQEELVNALCLPHILSGEWAFRQSLDERYDNMLLVGLSLGWIVSRVCDEYVRVVSRHICASYSVTAGGDRC